MCSAQTAGNSCDNQQHHPRYFVLQPHLQAHIERYSRPPYFVRVMFADQFFSGPERYEMTVLAGSGGRWERRYEELMSR